MTAAKIELAVRFVDTHPDGAADALEQHPPRAVAEFMQHLPPATGAALLERLLPHYAARLIELLPAERMPALLKPMPTRPIVALLRYLDPSARETILSHLPADRATGCRLLLDYSLETVGAWMVPQIAMLPDTTPLDTALGKLSRETAALDSDAVYVVDRDIRLRGIVSLPALLRAREQRPEQTVIGDVMERHPQTVVSRATLQSVQHHEGWNQSDTLPVLNRRQQLIGMLRHVDLRKGLDYAAGAVGGDTTADHAMADLYHTYRRVLFALCDVAGEMAGGARLHSGPSPDPTSESRED